MDSMLASPLARARERTSSLTLASPPLRFEERIEPSTPPRVMLEVEELACAA